MVRCKFKCGGKTQRTDQSGVDFVYDYDFFAVYNGSQENKEFWKYTPGGTLKVTAVRSDLFDVGKEYYLDITEATPSSV
jgi:hypothetical protein